MGLDPQARTLLDQLAAADTAPMESLGVDDARQAMAALLTAQTEPLAVARVEDKNIPGPGGQLPVRIYTPDGTAPFPVVVYFHGGGFVLGSLDTHDATCRALARESGSVVVAVDYRLAPEHKFPAAVEDAHAATAWVASHAEDLSADDSRIVVAGDSAGGNLAAVTALMARDRGGPNLALQLLIYPVTDAARDTPSYRENADGYLLTASAMEWFWDHYLSDSSGGADPYASPLRATDLEGLAPALILTAEFDPLRDEGEAYATRLEEAGVPVRMKRYDGMIHGFFGMGDFLDRAAEALTEAGTAVRSARLGG